MSEIYHALIMARLTGMATALLVQEKPWIAAFSLLMDIGNGVRAAAIQGESPLARPVEIGVCSTNALACEQIVTRLNKIMTPEDRRGTRVLFVNSSRGIISLGSRFSHMLFVGDDRRDAGLKDWIATNVASRMMTDCYPAFVGTMQQFQETLDTSILPSDKAYAEVSIGPESYLPHTVLAPAEILEMA